MSDLQEWEELSREVVFDNYRRIEKVVFRLPNGETADFYLRNEGQSVAVLALTEQNEVILARQYRPGPKRFISDLPGGGIDKGEEPLAAGERELLEETGYAGEAEYVGTYLNSVYSTRVGYYVVARNCRKVAEPHQTATEQTEVILMPLPEFRQHLRSGELGDVEIGYLGLDYLGLL